MLRGSRRSSRSEDALAAGFDIVDIREPKELEAIPTPTHEARHIPMAELLHGKATLVPTNKTLLVCASGKRSLAAAQELLVAGRERDPYSAPRRHLKSKPALRPESAAAASRAAPAPPRGTPHRVLPTRQHGLSGHDPSVTA